jgi:hypothetical protein
MKTKYVEREKDWRKNSHQRRNRVDSNITISCLVRRLKRRCEGMVDNHDVDEESKQAMWLKFLICAHENEEII